MPFYQLYTEGNKVSLEKLPNHKQDDLKTQQRIETNGGSYAIFSVNDDTNIIDNIMKANEIITEKIKFKELLDGSFEFSHKFHDANSIYYMVRNQLELIEKNNNNSIINDNKEDTQVKIIEKEKKKEIKQEPENESSHVEEKKILELKYPNRGTLQVPQDVKLIRSNLGIMRVTKPKTCLFSTPPKSPKINYDFKTNYITKNKPEYKYKIFYCLSLESQYKIIDELKSSKTNAFLIGPYEKDEESVVIRFIDKGIISPLRYKMPVKKNDKTKLLGYKNLLTTSENIERKKLGSTTDEDNLLENNNPFINSINNEKRVEIALEKMTFINSYKEVGISQDGEITDKKFWQAKIREIRELSGRKYTHAEPHSVSAADLSQGLHIVDFFEEKTIVIAASLPETPGVYKVYAFDEIKSTSKTLKDRKTEEFEKLGVRSCGYMFADDVEKLNQELGSFNEDIFQKKPTIEDIAQGGLGNCFFLSSLIAITISPQKGESFITGMMRQENDKTVVRFYDIHTREPIYVEVSNYLVYDKNKPISKHKAKWVDILEYAYAELECRNQNIFVSSLLSIDRGGTADRALMALTGEPALRYDIQEQTFNDIYTDTIFFISDQKSDDNRDTEQKISDKIKEGSSLCFALDNDVGLILRWTEYLNKLKNGQQDDKKSYSKIIYAILDFSSEERPSLNTLISALPNDKAITVFIQAFNRNLNFPKKKAGKDYYSISGGVLSGQYTEYQHHLFNKLKNIHAKGSALIASTKEAFLAENKIGSPIKAKAEGLIPGHAYSVINFEETSITSKIILMIKLRNPWRAVGRGYDVITQNAHETLSPLFRIDLHDFVKYFSHYYASSIPDKPRHILHDTLSLNSEDEKKEIKAELISHQNEVDPDFCFEKLGTTRQEFVTRLLIYINYPEVRDKLKPEIEEFITKQNKEFIDFVLQNNTGSDIILTAKKAYEEVKKSQITLNSYIETIGNMVPDLQKENKYDKNLDSRIKAKNLCDFLKENKVEEHEKHIKNITRSLTQLEYNEKIYQDLFNKSDLYTTYIKIHGENSNPFLELSLGKRASQLYAKLPPISLTSSSDSEENNQITKIKQIQDSFQQVEDKYNMHIHMENKCYKEYNSIIDRGINQDKAPPLLMKANEHHQKAEEAKQNMQLLQKKLGEEINILLAIQSTQKKGNHDDHDEEKNKTAYKKDGDDDDDNSSDKAKHSHPTSTSTSYTGHSSSGGETLTTSSTHTSGTIERTYTYASTYLQQSDEKGANMTLDKKNNEPTTSTSSSFEKPAPISSSALIQPSADQQPKPLPIQLDEKENLILSQLTEKIRKKGRGSNLTRDEFNIELNKIQDNKKLKVIEELISTAEKEKENDNRLSKLQRGRDMESRLLLLNEARLKLKALEELLIPTLSSTQAAHQVKQEPKAEPTTLNPFSSSTSSSSSSVTTKEKKKKKGENIKNISVATNRYALTPNIGGGTSPKKEEPKLTKKAPPDTTIRPTKGSGRGQEFVNLSV